MFILRGIRIRKLAKKGRGSLSERILVGKRKDKLGKKDEIRKHKGLTFLMLNFLILFFFQYEISLLISLKGSIRGGFILPSTVHPTR